MNRHEEVFDYGTPRAGWAVKIVWPDKPQANLQPGGIAALRQLLARSRSEQLLLSLNFSRLRRGDPRLCDRILWIRSIAGAWPGFLALLPKAFLPAPPATFHPKVTSLFCSSTERIRVFPNFGNFTQGTETIHNEGVIGGRSILSTKSLP